MDFIPVQQYNKDQVIITSDRLIFNSKDDSIINSTKKDFIITVGGGIHFNVGTSGKSSDNNKFVVNSPKIQFGLGQVEPITKGDQMVKVMNELINALQKLASNLSSAVGVGVGTVTEITVNTAGTTLITDLSNISSIIDDIKSKITYTA